MTPGAPETPALLAPLLTGTILRPEWTETEAALACESSKRLGLASVTVRPCDIDVAVRILGSSAVKPGSAVGFPHGDQNTGTKLYEARDLLRRGAREIDLLLGVSKLRSRQFQYVDMEVMQMAESCRKEGAILRVTLETGYLSDEQKIVACRICGRAEVPVVKTATGFGPAASVSDIGLLRSHLPEDTLVEAVLTESTVTEVEQALAAGAGRLSTSTFAQLLELWKQHAAKPAAEPLIS